MDNVIITKLKQTFEACIQEVDGLEFWFARDLQKLLGYDKWENFVKVVEKGKTACKNSSYEINDHFLDVRKKVDWCFQQNEKSEITM